MPILNYTTTVNMHRSAAQVHEMLARHGATRVMVEYDGTIGNRAPCAVAFTINTAHGLRDFKLPVDVAGVHKAMANDRSVPHRFRNLEQAQRVAWRILKDWTEAQLAIIEAGMTRMDEVMLPYMIVGPHGETVSQAYQVNAGSLAAIEAGP